MKEANLSDAEREFFFLIEKRLRSKKLSFVSAKSSLRNKNSRAHDKDKKSDKFDLFKTLPWESVPYSLKG